MSELEDLVAVYGAIDRAVQREPELAKPVAGLLPAYDDPGTAGWFEQFERWNDQVPGSRRLANLDTALVELAGHTPRPRMAARRLLAIAALARAHPGLVDDSAPLRAALAVEGIADADRAEDLLGRLTGPRFESIGQWEEFIREAVADGVLARAFLAQTGAPPCSGSVRLARTGTGGLVSAATLSTSLWTDEVTFECACRFLAPVNWPGCSDFWCAMDLITTKPNGNQVFHEIVSLACGNRGPVWRAEAYLEFGYTSEPTVATATFVLDRERTAATDWVIVDQGWLRVAVDGLGIRVSTVKTIAFADATFHSPGAIAAMMCAIGYGDAAGELMFNCAIDCAPGAGTPFPPAQVDDDGED